MADRSLIAKAIVDYVAENFIGGERPDIPLNQSLVEEGIIDSYGIIELIEFLESEFDVAIPDEDITKQNFGSINKVADYLVRIMRSAA
tara:strand:- start:18 stop:281 length:264 start_codon:yes stop_codon:yes gene_type:complete